jgi:LacI family transcriptional regulator
MHKMTDVARLADVSVATVSAVFNSKPGVRPELVKRVKDAIEALDYRPDYVARSLRTRLTHSIGMVIPDIENAFFAEMIRGVQDAARQARYSVILCITNDDVGEEKLYLTTLYSRRVDGILLGTTLQHVAEIPRTRWPCPMVLVDNALPGFQGDAVLVDNKAAAYQGTKHLIELGHTRIGVIAGPPNVSSSRDREEGFHMAMQEANLVVPPELVKSGGFRMEGGYHCGLEFLRMAGRPSAIFSCNYLMTVGLLRAIKEVGVECPREISIVAFDDFDTGLDGFSLASLFSPNLTTIRQPAYEVGKRAFERLLRRMTTPENAPDSSAGETLLLDTELIIRNSTAPPK